MPPHNTLPTLPPNLSHDFLCLSQTFFSERTGKNCRSKIFPKQIPKSDKKNVNENECGYHRGHACNSSASVGTLLLLYSQIHFKRTTNNLRYTAYDTVLYTARHTVRFGVRLTVQYGTRYGNGTRHSCTWQTVQHGTVHDT